MDVKVVSKRFIGIILLIILNMSLLVLALQFIDRAQSDFDSGTYANTTYNGSAIILSGTNVYGTYTSRIFNANSTVRWNNFSITKTLPTKEYLFAADDNSDVWSSINQGINWTLVKHDYNGADSNGAKASFFNSSGGYFIVYNQQVWASNDMGITWTKVKDDYNGAEGQNAYAAKADKINNFYIIEGDQDVWKSINAGVNWTKVASNFNGGGGNVAGLVVDSSNALFTVDVASHVYKSTDYGVTWTLIKDDYNGAEGNGADALAIDSANYLYVIKDQAVWRSTDSGVTWTKVSTDFDPSDGHNGISMTTDSNSYVYLIDGNEDVYKSTDSGSTWTKLISNYNGANGNSRTIISIVKYTNLTFQIRNCSSSDCSDSSFVGPDNTTSSYYPDNIGDIGKNSRYFQYKVYFSTQDSGIRSALYNVTLDYTQLNQEPIVASFTLTPNSPTTTNDLTCLFMITDPDAGDSLTTNVTWYKNAAVYSSITQSVSNGSQASTILDASNNVKNEIWNCTIIPYDGKTYGNQASSKVIIQNTAPSIDAIPDKSTDSMIYWSYNANATDIDHDEGVDTLTWSINNSMLDINSATGLISDTPSDSDEGTHVVKVTVSDGTNQSSTTFVYTVTANRAPNVTSISLLPSQPKTNDNINCSFIITDDRLQTCSANISWYRNNILNITSNISINNGTLSSSLLSYQYTVKGQEWNCTIIPFDGNSYGRQSSAKLTIINSLPTSPNISIIPVTPNTNNDLNVIFNQVSDDNDSDLVTYSYQWFRDNIYQPSITGSTVSSGVTSKNQIWKVIVTPNDGQENGNSISKNVTIRNSIPSISSANINPTTAYKTTTLTASTTGWSDLDGEPENYVYQWFNQNGKIIGATLPSLTGSYFNKSNRIFCNVTPYDSDEYGTSTLTNNVTIQNSIPILTVSIESQLGFNGTDEDLIASFSYSDADSDMIVANQTKWYKNNIEQPSFANQTAVSYTNIAVDNLWIFSARVYDNESWSNWYNASISILDVSQTYPILVSPLNGTSINISSVVLIYTTPNYANMHCSIFADTNPNPTAMIKNNTGLQGKTTLIFNWRNLADNIYYWKVGCTNDTILLNSTTKIFTIDTTYPTTAPSLTQLGVSDSDNDGNIELSWTADPDAHTYNIYRSLSKITDAANLIKIFSTSSTSWEDNSTLNSTTYWYALTTVDRAAYENKSVISNSFNSTSNDKIKPKIATNINASSINGVTTIYWDKVYNDINGNADESGLKYKLWYKSNASLNLSKTLVNETADYIRTLDQDSCSETICQTTHSLSGSTSYYYFITTIDDGNNENLTLNSNYYGITVTIAPPSTGGGGGGGGGGHTLVEAEKTPATNPNCKEEWSCSEWYNCANGVQGRSCVDINKCGTEDNKPEMSRPCGACEEKWQCGDWTPCVNNRQTRVCLDKNDCVTEKTKPPQEQDCMLDTCSDGIKNYGEVGIDCGGPCKPCKASDFITGGAIALKATKGPNRSLLIPTIILLLVFLFIKSIRKKDIRFNKILSALRIPLIVIILVLFSLSFFGTKIMNLFSANNQTISAPLEENKTEGIAPLTGLSHGVGVDKYKAKITSLIFFIIAGSVLAAFIVRKKFWNKSQIKKQIVQKEGISIEIKTNIKKFPFEDIDGMNFETIPVKSEGKKVNPMGKIQKKQDILNQIKENYRLDKISDNMSRSSSSIDINSIINRKIDK